MKHENFVQLVASAIDKLEAQGKPSSSDGGCYYIHVDEKGNKLYCVVGWMMPDDETREAAERCGVGGDTDVHTLKLMGLHWIKQFAPEQIDFMFSLQEIHDGWTCPSEACTVCDVMREMLKEYDKCRSN